MSHNDIKNMLKQSFNENDYAEWSEKDMKDARNIANTLNASQLKAFIEVIEILNYQQAYLSAFEVDRVRDNLRKIGIELTDDEFDSVISGHHEMPNENYAQFNLFEIIKKHNDFETHGDIAAPMHSS